MFIIMIRILIDNSLVASHLTWMVSFFYVAWTIIVPSLAEVTECAVTAVTESLLPAWRCTSYVAPLAVECIHN